MVLISLMFIFALGSLAGWIIEFFYRSIHNGHLTNPGFLNGTYLPMYGFGISFLYIISSMDMSIIIRVIIFGITTTVLELITGLIFTNYFKIRLWDYSKELLNFKGQICLRFSLYWTVLSLLFYLMIYPHMESFVNILEESYLAYISLGFYYGLITMDIYESFSLAVKIRKAVMEFNKKYLTGLRIDMRDFKMTVRTYLKKGRKVNSVERFFVPFTRLSNMELLDRFNNELLQKMKKKVHFNKK
ncbi:hypothetical protein B6U90_02980 [Thermoplasmatales archaeon ex4484_6]|nr:MAG: hypothetical protein B6U90_02980 [Thermoplasmatales archaeon ex4484_6]